MSMLKIITMNSNSTWTQSYFGKTNCFLTKPQTKLVDQLWKWTISISKFHDFHSNLFKKNKFLRKENGMYHRRKEESAEDKMERRLIVES